MTVSIAHAAATQVIATQVIGAHSGPPELLASGRSSTAWAVHDGTESWVVRVPIPDSGRLLSYRSEARIGRLLGEAQQPVAQWTVVDVDGLPCSVAQLLPGAPVVYGEPFAPVFASALAQLLHVLHTLDVVGFGPLHDTDEQLAGRSASRTDGIVDRWFHARMWPFDDRELDGHVAHTLAPALAMQACDMAAEIVDAARGAVGVVHSDLHADHLLRDEAGALTAVLDFGDAFIGAIAWDFALLHWYYGRRNAELVAAAYPGGMDESERGRYLAVAVGLYKMAKSPGDTAVPARLADVMHELS